MMENLLGIGRTSCVFLRARDTAKSDKGASSQVADVAEGARAGPAPVFRARELTAGTPRRRITNVFKQERLNLSGVWARVRLHRELRRVGCVRKVLGTTIHQEISRLRMREACRLLEESAHPAAEVGKLSGFSSPQYFNRQFCRHFGIPPAEYRRRHGR